MHSGVDILIWESYMNMTNGDIRLLEAVGDVRLSKSHLRTV